MRTNCAPRLLLLVLLLTLPAAVEAQFTYTTSNGKATITGYTGPGGAVTIPNTTNGSTVVSIGDYAFSGPSRTNVTSVTIPSSVTNIGYFAFANCNRLAKVTLTNGISTIGQGAFSSCTSLTNITIPVSVSNIVSDPFTSCTSLTAITVDALNPYYSGVDGVLYDASLTRLIQYPAGKSGSNYVIPNSVTRIGGYAFSRCSSLTNLTIGNGVTNIGFFAFYYCTGLISLTMPDSVTSIETYAFYYCTGLSNVTFGSNVTSIGTQAFTGCSSTKLTAIYFLGNAPSDDGSLLSGFFNLTSYHVLGTTGWGSSFGGRPTALWSPQVPCVFTVNNGAITVTKYIGDGGEVTIPSTISGLPVLSIGSFAFYSCAKLTSVMIAGNVTNFGSSAFYNCTGLTNVTMPSSLTSIGSSAFYNCVTLAGVTIPIAVATIGDSAFSGCTQLSAITVDSLNSFYSSVDGVLFDKSQTTLIQYPPGKAGSYAVPNTVTMIGPLAFDRCFSLTHVTIPSGVTNIGSPVFTSCTSLEEISVDAPNPLYSSVDGVLFNKSQTTLIRCPWGKAGSYTVPSTVTNIGLSAFSYCLNLTTIVIPSSVTNISGVAFFSCNPLSGVYFQGNAPSVISTAFSGANNATVYYLPGTTNWGATFAGRPTVLWKPQMLTSNASFGVRTNQFGFNISWVSNMVVAVDACTNLANPIWSPLQTNTLSGDTLYFSDPQWTNYPARFYRLRWS